MWSYGLSCGHICGCMFQECEAQWLILAFVGMILAARILKVLEEWRKRCPNLLQKIPGDVRPNIDILGVFGQIGVPAESVDLWWGRAIGKEAIVEDRYRCHGFSRMETWLTPSETASFQLAGQCTHNFYGLVCISCENRVNQWSWSNVNMTVFVSL